MRALARLKRDEVRHIPFPAYIWRRDGGSYSVKFIEKATANARRALSESYAGAEVAPAHPAPTCTACGSIAARARASPSSCRNRDSFRLFSLLAEGLFERTDYPDFELIVVDNGSTDPDTLALYDRLKREKPNFTLEIAPAPFNFSRQVNRGVALAQGEVVLLLNNDIEVIEPDWLAEMVECLGYPDVGVVGARLLYPNGDLQHAGVVVGLGGLAGHWYAGRPADFPGPMGRLAVRSTMTAVTRRLHADLARLPRRGRGRSTRRISPSPTTTSTSACAPAPPASARSTRRSRRSSITNSRPRPRRPRPHARFLRAQAALIERHGTQDFLDPALSPWRDRDHSEPGRIALKALPPAR